MAVTTANRVQITSVIEQTLGVTPVTPRMRTKLITGESLKYTPTFTSSNELHSDRMTTQPVVVGLDSSGSLNWEWHYPVEGSPEDADLQSAFYNNFVNTPLRSNDGTADSVITDIGTTTDTITVLTGTSFVIGHLVRTTGFATSGNNQIARVTTGGATSLVCSGAGYVAEVAPPATARVKVVGFAGVSGDITATASGLASTALDFTTLGLVPGQWIKVGGTADVSTFAFLVTAGAAARAKARMRVTSVTAHAIVCDNLPTGWTTDTGTSKLIKVWFGDQIRNGVTQISQTIEKGFLGQTTPTYIAQPGMVVNQWSMNITPKQIITGSTAYTGMSGTVSTTTLDASPDPSPSQALYPQFAGSINVGQISENGVGLSAPNWCTAFSIQLSNNLGIVESIDGLGPQDMVGQECTITGTAKTIFGDSSILNRFFAGTPTAFNCVMQKGNQMVILQAPFVTLNSDGSPNATGKNTIIEVSYGWAASKDEALTQAMLLLDRIEYFE